MRDFKKAGFSGVSYSDGDSAEGRSQQLLIGSTRSCKVQQGDLRVESKLRPKYRIQTMVYKIIDGTLIEADVYFPRELNMTQAMAVGNQPPFFDCDRPRCLLISRLAHLWWWLHDTL